MKHTTANTKKQKQETIPFLDYSIVSVKLPKFMADFDGYFLGQVFIHECKVRPALVGCTLSMLNKGLATLDTSFIYTTQNVKVDGEQLLVDEPSGIRGLKDSLTLQQVKEIVMQVARNQNLPQELLQIAMQMICANMPPSVPASLVAQHLPTCNLNRFPLIHVLYIYFVTNKYDEEQKKRLRDLSLEQLHELKHLLSTEPWTLVFGMHKLRGLREDKLNRALREFQLAFRYPMHIQYAVKMYYRVMQEREEGSHTVFNKGMLNLMLPCMHVDKRAEMERQVFGYLQEKAFVFTPASSFSCGEGGGGKGGKDEHNLNVESNAMSTTLLPPPHLQPNAYVSTKYDHLDARLALDALIRIQMYSRFKEPTLRGCRVPQLFPPLTTRQTEIAEYITTHWLTVVEGMPGTGKTALITWCVSHYQNVMLVSFVGMMAKSLQKRNGRRKEVAHTIHHVLAQKKYGGEAAQDWLKEFDVLIVDEFSNVSMTLFLKLLCCLPHLKKVVLVGDHRQCKPIEGGDPMGDMIGIFGSQMLYDNLRVVPKLKALQNAPSLIASGQAAQLNFTTPCLSIIGKSMEHLYSVFASKAKELNILMNLHIVALVNQGNDGRKHLNEACQDLWIKLGVLSAPIRERVTIRGKLDLFPGCKITFSQNYNKPLTITLPATMKNQQPEEIVTSPISNGELCIVESIERRGEGFILRTVDSLNPDDDPEHKVIWLHERTGVSPAHVELGYVTTVYRSQGECAPPPPFGRGRRNCVSCFRQGIFQKKNKRC